MSNIIPKTEWIKTWSENGVGWIQLNHDNKLNPLSAAFILAIKDAAKTFDNDLKIGAKTDSEHISGIDALFEAITGQPQAIASSGGKPKPSYKEGNIKAVALL